MTMYEALRFLWDLQSDDLYVKTLAVMRPAAAARCGLRQFAGIGPDGEVFEGTFLLAADAARWCRDLANDCTVSDRARDMHLELLHALAVFRRERREDGDYVKAFLAECD
jgi:hypothetical protein